MNDADSDNRLRTQRVRWLVEQRERPGMISLLRNQVVVESMADVPRALALRSRLIGPSRRRLMGAARSGDRLRMHFEERRWAYEAGLLLGIDIRIVGKQLIDPDEPYLVAPLHEGFADAIALLQLPLRQRFVVRRDLLEWPFLGTYLQESGHLVVDPEAPVGDVARLVEMARDLADRGDSIVMFPQGTVIGIEAAFRPGAAWLATRLGVRILPVILAGSHRVWEQPFAPRLRFDQPLYVEVMAPVEPSQFAPLEREMKDRALVNGHAAPRRYDPARDGYWDGYAFEIDAAFSDLAAAIARHRARSLMRRAR